MYGLHRRENKPCENPKVRQENGYIRKSCGLKLNKQFEIIRSLLTRVEEDSTQMKMIINFIKDNFIKKS